ncbi:MULTISPECIES: Abi family protein [Halomonadaceae]|jgi:hypothetical protein|uniref:Abi family protein n=2 Tax=Vreelandella TaxID=3137766 RepID=A0A7Z0LXI3_9GAMM|nr:MULTISPECIES: Abi family protein [Halomonas]NYS80495.1 Abi family protein [Halomonas glaciei]|tara:strand:- start:849 stop:1568 length:720 start_codon:yes stop_codon:yes gene_type:complete
MTEEEAKIIIEKISIPRIKTYTDIGFPENSEELILAYFYIQEISSHFFVPLQILEISLRNAIHDALTKRFNKRYPGKKWYNNVHHTHTSVLMLNSAKQKTEDRSGSHYSDDDLVANLSFGFWVYMLDVKHRTPNYPYSFWQYEAGNIFPGNHGKTIGELFSNFKKIIKIRNRLYHHEPVWKNSRPVKDFRGAISRLEREYQIIFDAIGWISPEKKIYMENELDFKNKFKACCDQYRHHK